MKRKKLLNYISLALLMLFGKQLTVDAQSFYARRIDRAWTFSYGVGFSTYHGDLHDFLYDRVWSATGPSVGIGLGRRINSQTTLKLDLNYYTIQGDDAANGLLRGRDAGQRTGQRSGQDDTRYLRNLSFKARNFEASLMLRFDLIPENRPYLRRRTINLHLMMGIGLTTNNPKGEHPTAGKVNLRHLNTEALSGLGYAATALVIPIGFGLRVRLTQFVDITFEAGRRMVFSDYLDDVSTVYPTEKNLTSARRVGSLQNALLFFDRSEEGGFEKRKPGNIRGNPDKNDAYYLFQVRLEAYLPKDFLKRQRRKRRPRFR